MEGSKGIRCLWEAVRIPCTRLCLEASPMGGRLIGLSWSPVGGYPARGHSMEGDYVEHLKACRTRVNCNAIFKSDLMLQDAWHLKFALRAGEIKNVSNRCHWLRALLVSKFLEQTYATWSLVRWQIGAWPTSSSTSLPGQD